MLEPALLEYIKNTLAQGFPKEQIRQELLNSGWQEADITAGFITAASQSAKPAPPVAAATTKPTDMEAPGQEPAPETIEEGFFSRHQKALIIILIALVALPVVAYGGFLLYQKFMVKSSDNSAANEAGNRPEDKATEDAALKTRDETRIKDVATIQTALENFYKTNKFYPKNLTDLKEMEKGAPSDPQTKEPYLYKALGEPAIHYSLSFVLEGRMGTLKPGLQVVSSEQRLPAELLKNQEAVIQGEVSPALSDKLLVTELDKTPFLPGEEVRINIQDKEAVPLKSAFLIIDKIELTDTAAPFEFSFTAPKNPGSYSVQIFAFDSDGAGYLQRATLIVK